MKWLVVDVTHHRVNKRKLKKRMLRYVILHISFSWASQVPSSETVLTGKKSFYPRIHELVH